jgi:hypothetical protein
MKRYLSVTVGTSPDQTTEIFFSDDAGLIDLVVACLLTRLERAAPMLTEADTRMVALH